MICTVTAFCSNSALTRRELPLGAGLTIVRKIVERHGGQIWVNSEYGQGSVFYFTLET